MDQLLKNKNILVMGVANNRSIAWAIAQCLYKHGANLIITYESDRVKERVYNLTKQLPGSLILPCDVTKDEEIDSLRDAIQENFGVVHGFVHSIAFANREDLQGMYVDISREGFSLALDISSYSLVAVSQRLYPLMNEGGSIIAMTYLGAERVFKNYNVMGVAKAALESSIRYLANDLGQYNIRVNGISAGPIRTLAGKGIKDFNTFIKSVEEKMPLRRSVDPAEVADTALFLLSDLSRGITGEIIFVDHGYQIMGV